MYNLGNCPVCGCKSFKESLVCMDHTVSGEFFNIVDCKDCGFKFTNPRPSDECLGEYYKSESYISHTNTTKGLVSKLYHLVRNYTLRKKLRLIERYVSRGTILDYGCGTGMFLSFSSRKGWDTYGIEPDVGARKIACEALDKIVSSKEAFEAVYPELEFDAISLWHVLEHVTDLDITLKFLQSKLKKSGVLIVAVPNYRSYDAQVYGEYWAAYDVPRHLYHFNEETINSLFESYSFVLASSHPMIFDSFYVSMLSEKYRSGSVSYLSAFLSGLRSNYAARTTKEYSSRIYVFRRK